eukprot:CAMPEP_0201148724 /NCGR_PEP_ID=MMETSP0851-20130426/10138_1 /ASSEMBLY_ACC=CAM_ASM_000631 /TAXON_ID=183588 /ORGANISM="Pseudo-nitzschia fraudulenta, Strain WWA7" /LENGTH=239 /DNA_ID=CAMNT_0047424945 /DNA_START=116 /DNA_END=836 /DNA_ORIENTATION=+
MGMSVRSGPVCVWLVCPDSGEKRKSPSGFLSSLVRCVLSHRGLPRFGAARTVVAVVVALSVAAPAQQVRKQPLHRRRLPSVDPRPLRNAGRPALDRFGLASRRLEKDKLVEEALEDVRRRHRPRETPAALVVVLDVRGAVVVVVAAQELLAARTARTAVEGPGQAADGQQKEADNDPDLDRGARGNLLVFATRRGNHRIDSSTNNAAHGIRRPAATGSSCSDCEPHRTAPNRTEPNRTE